MANTNLTPDLVLKEFGRGYKNQAAFLQGISRQYDKSYEAYGAKAGQSIRIEIPQRLVARSGKTAVPQNSTEKYVTLTTSQMFGVDLKFSSAELTQDISSRGIQKKLATASRVLVSKVQTTFMQTAYQQIYNNVGTFGTNPNASLQIGQLNAMLDKYSTPDDGNRSLVINPDSNASLADAFKGLFNPQDGIRDINVRGKIGMWQDLDFAKTADVMRHTNGTYDDTTPITVTSYTTAADGQSSTITMTGGATTGTLTAGTKFNLTGGAGTVFGVNPLNYQSIGSAQQFTVSADATASGGNITVTVTPGINTTGAYQTVTLAPTNQTVTFYGLASASAAACIGYHEDAFAYATADLELPGMSNFESRQVVDNTSLRIYKYLDGTNDDLNYRIDVLCGFITVVPEWACVLWAA